MFCPSCGLGMRDEDNYNFCPRCGFKFAEPGQANLQQNQTVKNEANYVASMTKIKQELDVKEPNTKKRVLIVEDDLFIRELYQKQLELAGYSVETAIEGMQAKELVFNEHFDLLLLDIMLPKMNGLDLLKIIKENDKTKELPVIILSNLGQEPVMEKGLRMGAIQYIVKADITPMELLRIVEDKIGH